MNMQIIDEKSLIKKYQTEIRCLKEELEQLKRGIVTVPQMKDSADGDILLLKQKVILSMFKVLSGIVLFLQFIQNKFLFYCCIA